MRRCFLAFSLFGILSLFAMAGCGKKGVPPVDVNGKVTVNGTEISEAGYVVTFFPNYEGEPRSIDVTESGTFAGKAPQGTCSVTLTKKGAEGAHGGATEGGEAPSYVDEFEPLEKVEVSGDAPMGLDFRKANGKGPGGGH